MTISEILEIIKAFFNALLGIINVLNNKGDTGNGAAAAE